MLAGIDQSAYSKIERGERYLSFEQCKRVALAPCTPAWIIWRDSPMKKPLIREKRQSEGLPWPMGITLYIGAFTVTIIVKRRNRHPAGDGFSHEIVAFLG